MAEKALSRDDLIKLLFEKDFFASNPALRPIAETINNCKLAYVKDARGRCCGGNIGIMFPAIDALFQKLGDLKQENDPGVKTFCDFLARKKGFDTAQFMIYYRKTKEGRPERLSLP